MRLNNVMKKILAAGLAATMVMANAGVSFADYSVAGGKTPFSKYLVSTDVHRQCLKEDLLPEMNESEIL